MNVYFWREEYNIVLLHNNPLHLCYLGFPHLWVNGEKYVFSSEVLEAGQKLL